MSGRPRGARGASSREGNSDGLGDEYIARAIEALKKCKEYNDKSAELQAEQQKLEEDMKKNGTTQEGCARLDTIARAIMRNAELETKTLQEEDPASLLQIVATMRQNDISTPRNGQAKPRKQQRPIVESDIVESPGPSPNEGRSEMMKRVKGTSQRSSSTASQNRVVASSKEDGGETNVGVQAEKRGDLVVGAQVFYKFPDNKPQKDSKDHLKVKDEGVGTHMVIKKVLQDRRPILYDLRDPEEDPGAKPTNRRVTAKHMLLIPTENPPIQIFKDSSNVYAQYPGTDTFYRAIVKSYQKDTKKEHYRLNFEDDDQPPQEVEARFIFEHKN